MIFFFKHPRLQPSLSGCQCSHRGAGSQISKPPCSQRWRELRRRHLQSSGCAQVTWFSRSRASCVTTNSGGWWGRGMCMHLCDKTGLMIPKGKESRRRTVTTQEQNGTMQGQLMCKYVCAELAFHSSCGHENWAIYLLYYVCDILVWFLQAAWGQRAMCFVASRGNLR